MTNRRTGQGPERRAYAWAAGIAVSILAVTGGFVLERGAVSQLGNLTAALIVIGGTFGAVLTGTPVSAMASAWQQFRKLFFAPVHLREEIARNIPEYALVIRRSGLRLAEQEFEFLNNGFLRRALQLVIDGVPSDEVRRQLEDGMNAEEDSAEAAARVFEQAAGYAPTIGIVGAILGLIRVMNQFAGPNEIGHGIAGAFVSTLYGVALANLILLPIACRIRSCCQSERAVREVVLDGVTAIAEGQSMGVIRSRMAPHFDPEERRTEDSSVESSGGALKAAWKNA